MIYILFYSSELEKMQFFFFFFLIKLFFFKQEKNPGFLVPSLTEKTNEIAKLLMKTYKEL